MSERNWKTEEGKFTHEFCLKQLGISQEADRDNRERAREDLLFLAKPNGMWEYDWENTATDKPKYQFDLVTPIIKQITGEIKQAEFGIEVEPMDGKASEETAKTFNGMIRNIQSLSYAVKRAFNPAAETSIKCGISGWRVVQKYIDQDSFDQDLAIERLANFHDRVWFDVNSEQRDGSDSEWCWVMHALSDEAYEAKYPDMEQSSLDPDVEQNAYWQKKDVVIVGEFYYLREEEKEIVLTDLGNVYEAEQWDKVKDEQAALEREKSRRNRKIKKCYVRQFDQAGWLKEEQETVFDYVPVVPEYSNFDIIDNKVVYHGAVTKLKDVQRVLNYALSRQVEEVALAPREKLVMTREQASGHESQLKTMNTNTDPVQFYTFVENQPPPFKMGGPVMNPGLSAVSETMSILMNQVGGKFAANMGDNPNAQSGVAIQALQDKGDTHDYDYTENHEIALTHTFRILKDAIPRVYSGERQARILNEDGSAEFVDLYETVADRQTGEDVTLNDLSQGSYSVTCKAGPAFRNRQDKTVQAFLEIAQVKPEVLEIGADVFLRNINAPGVDQVADRLRQQLFESGVIPEDQLTEEEKEILQRMQMLQQMQGQKPSPEEMLGQAELIKAQNERDETQISVQEKRAKLAQSGRNQQLEEAKFAHTRRNDMVRLMLEIQEANMKQQAQITDAVEGLRQALSSITLQ